MPSTAGLRLSIAVLVVSVGVTACGTSRSARSDKAGGSGAPVVLRLVTAADPGEPPDKDWLAYFAAETRKLSHGTVRVKLVFNAEGGFNGNVNADEDAARDVMSGKYDLGWTATRVWDLLGVNSLRALQAPFVITSSALMKRVAQSSVPAEAMAGLGKIGITGLAIAPTGLRFGFGRRPFVSPSDYAGARVRVFPSQTLDALFRALGATPVHVSDDVAGKMIADGKIDLVEASGYGPPLSVITHVAFYAKFASLFAGKRAFDRLTAAQREAVRAAAARTAARATGEVPGSASGDEGFVKLACRDPHTVVIQPTAAQLATLEHATTPVIAQLRRDPQTASLLDQIAKLKAATSVAPSVVPAACARHTLAPAPAARVKPTASHALDGTYRYVLTKDDARHSVNTPDRNHVDEYPQVLTVFMRAGRWRAGTASGVYAIKGNHLLVTFGDNTVLLVFAFTREADGTLHLKQINTTNPGDTFVWTTEPWRRIGPAPAKVS